MELFILGAIAGGLLVALLCGRRTSGLEGDIMIEPKPPTRVVRPWEEHRGYRPNRRPVDWSKVQRPTGSAVSPPANPRLKDRG